MTASEPLRAERAPAGTPDELLAVAERLFAERGVENVALTQIVAESGQKNRSALHYHFGSRGDVLTAVLNRRLAPINARREAELDALPPSPGPAAVLRAAAWALGETVVAEPWGADYVTILAQVLFHPRLLGRDAVDEALLTGVRRARRMATAAVPRQPAELVGRRLAWFNETVVFALARWVRDTPPARRTRVAAEDLVDQLTAYGAAGLAAPAPSSEDPLP
jgi:AcrR family transcriptional regulator